MSVVTVNVGGQSVPVQVQTYQFGDQSLSASVEAGIAAVVGAVAGAQAAEAGAQTAQSLSEGARDGAVIAKGLAEEYRDETAVYAGTTNITNYYPDTTAGLAGTASGAYFGVPGTDGVAIYRDNSGVAAAGPVIPSIDYIGKRPQFIKCVASAVTSGNSFSITPVDPNIRYAGTAESEVWAYEAPAANIVGSGGIDITIKNGAGTDFATITLRKKGFDVLDGTEFEAGDLVFIRRAKAAENAGQPLLWMNPPNPALKTAARDLQTLALQQPSTNFAVSIQRVDDTNYVVRHHSLRGSANYAVMESDHVISVFKDLAVGMSQGSTKIGSALALNSEWLIQNGREVRYCQFLSNELSGGNWSREQPSTTEPVDRFGVYGTAVANYEIVGLNHPGGIENTLADRTMTMDGITFTLKVGEIKDGSELVIGQSFRTFYDAGTNRNGEAVYRHTVNANGITIYKRMNIGRRLPFDAGVSAPAIGATLNGGTSGAVSILCANPTAIQTGTWGSTRAGQMFVKHVSGTWQDNEAIKVGGITVATVNGTLGQQVGVANAYGPLMCTTAINRVKMTGYPALTVGAADGSQRPNGSDPVGTWATPGNTFSAYHTNNIRPDGSGPMRCMYVPSGPMTPPGNFSLCNSTKVFLEDRNGGNRKVVLNWCSTAVGDTTGAELAEGIFETSYTIYWQDGVPA